MSDITVNVAVSKKYLVDYVQAKYGYGYNEPVIASQSTDIGKVIKSLLAKTPCSYKPKSIEGTVITFLLPYYNDLNIKVYNYLSPNSEELIDRWIKNRFNQETRDFLSEALDNKIPLKNAIIMFCEQYGIAVDEDDATYEAIKKDFYRYRKKRINKNAASLCSSFGIFL